jgi:hypothetical protein
VASYHAWHFKLPLPRTPSLSLSYTLGSLGSSLVALSRLGLVRAEIRLLFGRVTLLYLFRTKDFHQLFLIAMLVHRYGIRVARARVVGEARILRIGGQTDAFFHRGISAQNANVDVLV